MCVQRMTDPKKMERQSCRSAEIMARNDLFTMDSLIHVAAKLWWRMCGLRRSCRNGETMSIVLACFPVLGRFDARWLGLLPPVLVRFFAERFAERILDWGVAHPLNRQI
jgi:hypothetical protein